MANPHVMVQMGTQYQLKLNVYLAVKNNQLLKSFFIEGNLTGPKYLRLLQEQLSPALRAMEEDVSEFDLIEIFY
jgi:hypothetical protein